MRDVRAAERATVARPRAALPLRGATSTLALAFATRADAERALGRDDEDDDEDLHDDEDDEYEDY